MNKDYIDKEAFLAACQEPHKEEEVVPAGITKESATKIIKGIGVVLGGLLVLIFVYAMFSSVTISTNPTASDSIVYPPKTFTLDECKDHAGQVFEASAFRFIEPMPDGAGMVAHGGITLAQIRCIPETQTVVFVVTQPVDKSGTTLANQILENLMNEFKHGKSK